MNVAVVNIGEFREKFRVLLGPDQMGGCYPLTKLWSLQRREFVVINRAAKLQTIESSRFGKNAGHPGPVVIGIATVSGFTENRGPAVAQTHAVAQA